MATDERYIYIDRGRLPTTSCVEDFCKKLVPGYKSQTITVEDLERVTRAAMTEGKRRLATSLLHEHILHRQEPHLFGANPIQYQRISKIGVDVLREIAEEGK